MVATKAFGDLTRLRGWIAGGAAGTIVAAVVATLPAAALEALVGSVGLPSLIDAAAPPIGATGRTLLALVAGVAAALAIGAFAAFVTARSTRIATAEGVPVLRRADAHPDAPARRPIRAAEDFGAPMPLKVTPAASPPPEPERPLPADLDQPLAAFDPAALPDTPRAPVRAVPALAPRPALIDPGERFDTFVLTPITRAAPVEETPAPAPAPVEEAPEPVVASEPPRTAGSTIDSLIERLERAGPRRAPAPANLDETLGMLRRLATS